MCRTKNLRGVGFKVQRLQRFTSQKLKMLLKWDNRWRSRSNTFKDIYISLSLEFIVGCQAAIPIFDILIGFGDYGRKTEPLCRNFPIFGVFFRPSWPSQTKIQKSGSTNSNDYCFGGFAKIWLKSVAQIRRIFAEKPSQNRVAYATRATITRFQLIPFETLKIKGYRRKGWWTN